MVGSVGSWTKATGCVSPPTNCVARSCAAAGAVWNSNAPRQTQTDRIARALKRIARTPAKPIPLSLPDFERMHLGQPDFNLVPVANSQIQRNESRHRPLRSRRDRDVVPFSGYQHQNIGDAALQTNLELNRAVGARIHAEREARTCWN